MSYDKELNKENCIVTFDPVQSEKLAAVFAHPKARALWMGYRMWHIIDQYTAESLPEACLDAAKECEKLVMAEAMRVWPDEKLASWLAPRLMAGSHYTTYDAFTRGDYYAIGQYALDRLAGKETKEIEEPDHIRFARFMRPYLTGEKVAEFTIRLEEKKDD